MAENKMKEVAELLGVEFGKPFKIEGALYNPFVINNDGLIDCEHDNRCKLLSSLLAGELEIEHPILAEKEKCYLENVLRPFKNRNISIQKRQRGNNLFIALHVGDDYTPLPDFKNGTMYKGMKLNKEYTLEELGLFEEE